MAAIENEHAYGLHIRESATDGSDFANADADYRRLFLGEDGLLHLKDASGTVTDIGAASSLDALVAASSGEDIADALAGAAAPDAGNVFATMDDVTAGGGLTDHTHAVTGSGATGGGASLAPTALILPTSLGTTQGQVDWDPTNKVAEVYDTQRERAVSNAGWVPLAFAMGDVRSAAYTTALNLAAAGGSLAVPVIVASHMLLQDVAVRNTDTGTARTWGWDLYVQRLNDGNSGENALDRVAACTSNESFTPGGSASTRVLNVGSAPVYLAPGVYWLVIQNRHASNTFGVGTVSGSGTFGLFISQTKTTTNPNGSTIDLVAATWSKSVDIAGVALRGRVFGQTASF